MSVADENADDVTASAKSIAEAFDLQGPLSVEPYDARARLHEHLQEILRQKLSGEESRIMPMFYRLDIAEAKIQAVFAETNAAEVPARLADLIIDRQLEKARTRRLYRAGEL
jgi:hypothetical protein